MAVDLHLWNPRLWDATAVVAARVAGTIVLAWICHRLGSRLIRLFRSRGAAHITDTEHARRMQTLAHVFHYLVTAVITLVAGMLVLSELGISVAPILGAAGVVGLAIGFGAQSLVKDYVAGFFLLLENQITRGDVVEVAGKAGAVEDVTLRYVQLRDNEGSVHFVPNGLITTVTNMSRGHAYAVMEVGVAYSADLTEVYAALRAVATQLREVPAFAARIEETLEILGVERLDGSAVIVRCRLRVRPLEQWRVRREFLLRLKAEFERRNIELSTPPTALPAPAAGAAKPI